MQTQYRRHNYLDEAFISPTQPKPIEEELQSRSEWLCRKKLFTSQFEATLDRLEGDGPNIINEFVDWESSSSTFSFNKLRDALCGEAKFRFNANHMYLFGLACTGRDLENYGHPEK